MKKYIGFLTIALSLALTSCNDWLDKLPDDRATVDSKKKVGLLLVSAYPLQTPNFMMEQSSDNVLDNGKQYTFQPIQDECYRFQPVDVASNDSPYYVWLTHYMAVAAANQALASIDKLGGGEELNGEKAEALLCRAWAIFRLSNAFCMAYDPEKASTYQGLPYPKEPGVTITERGTLEELYQNINEDIEAAIPLLDDSHLSVPKYHFNAKAAYAFAARFNLYYHHYDKAIQYATAALGEKPAGVLRDLASMTTLAGVDDISNAYIRSSSPANLLQINSYSTLGRAQYDTPFKRFATNRTILEKELFWAKMPWGSSSAPNTLYYASMIYGSNQTVRFPKLEEYFEVTDKVNKTGSLHIVDVVLSTDEALLVRAEAYALRNQAEDSIKSIADINLWIGNHCAEKDTYSGKTVTRPTMTVESLNEFMNSIGYSALVPQSDLQRTIKKHLVPQGFTVAKGTQENLIQFILHLRRLETWQQGLRFQDIKRYGIAFSHIIDDEDPVVFKAGDPRGALQIPTDVIAAGMNPNLYDEPQVPGTATTDDEQNGRYVHLTE